MAQRRLRLSARRRRRTDSGTQSGARPAAIAAECGGPRRSRRRAVGLSGIRTAGKLGTLHRTGLRGAQKTSRPVFRQRPSRLFFRLRQSSDQSLRARSIARRTLFPVVGKFFRRIPHPLWICGGTTSRRDSERPRTAGSGGLLAAGGRTLSAVVRQQSRLVPGQWIELHVSHVRHRPAAAVGMSAQFDFQRRRSFYAVGAQRLSGDRS
ncbi:hypothetical protein SDC9_113228 [bioreactor metagenome]|uniref:Uncharacterized protein n=1 Tax=bioreactor metagenome TaxID=1076179 RepID=A0A645BP16_9ZZZZ